MKPIEAVLYLLQGFCQCGVPESRVIAKGLSQCQRAKLLREKSAAFRNPVWITLDASRFDLHVSKDQLRVEHSVYRSMCNDPELAKLLSWQLVNKGRIRSAGISYVSDGGRMSGDQNTAVGNCVLMLVMVAAFMEKIKCCKYDVLDDGDDIVVIVEKGDEVKLLDEVKAGFLEFGHEVKIENVAYAFEDLEWCQCHPVEFAPNRWKLVRNPFKILKKGLAGTKYFNNPDDATRRKLINSLGHCELVLNRGVPVLQAYAEMCIRISGTDELLAFDSVDEYYDRIQKELRGMNRKISEIRSDDISAECRLSFQRAFGISVDDQLQLEEWFESLEIDILGSEDVCDKIDMIARVSHFGASSSVYSWRE
jgi:hypothetical protein